MPAYKDEKKKTWYVQFKYKNWRGERKAVMKRGFTTKREALQWEQDFHMRNEGSLDMSFSEFYRVYCEDRLPRIKDSTASTKDNIVETKLLPYFGDKRLRDIDTRDVINWQNELLRYRDPVTAQPYSKSYLKTIHNQLSAIFNHAVKYYKLDENPAAKVGNMGSDKGIRMKFWTREEYMRFAEYMMDDPMGYYYFELLYWCGLREGEALALTMEDFDLSKGVVSVTKTYSKRNGVEYITEPKTPKSVREIAMPQFLVQEMRDCFSMMYDLKPTERIFSLSKSYLYRKMTEGSKTMGLPRIRVHDLRHSHVSLLIDMGYSVVAIADRMGHESIDITYRYAHLFPSIQKNMVDKLNKLREGEESVGEGT